MDDTVAARIAAGAREPDLEGTKYRLVGELGRGGMGDVWLALDTDLGREVALKVSRVVDRTGELAARLRREARVVARLEHPAIVPVHDVGTLPDGRVFYAMKVVRGRPLDAWLDEAPRPRAQVLRLFAAMADAIAFAHARGVIHRDLKPQNVMVGAFGEVLVMDWGLAKSLGTVLDPSAPAADPADEEDPTELAVADTRVAEGGGATLEGAVLGTPGFMAPEQARGEVSRLDARTDVFALGAILYALLAGREPFRGASADEVMQRVIESAPEPLDGVRPAPPKPVAAIAMRALAKAPEARYASAEEMAADVRRFLDGERVRAHEESFLERTLRFADKHKVLLLLLAAYLAMRIVIFAAFRE
jgi:eukaryotic-like serine/threonine-protein kinase